MDFTSLKTSKNKKGVSEIVGYVLLIVFVVIMAAIVFVWLKTYIPAESLNCPDSVSLFIKEYTLDCDANSLNLTMKNNGRFSYAGFFIHASNESGQEVATIDFSQYLKETTEIKKVENSVVYIGDGGNPIKPGNESGAFFNFSGTLGNNLSVTLVPIRFQIENNRNRLVSCSNAKLTQKLQCGTESIEPPGPSCFPASDPAYESLCSGRVCGKVNNGTCDAVTCLPDDCGTEFFCDADGRCISNSCAPVSDPCGARICGTATNGSCGAASCGTCDINLNLECNIITGQCESSLGNGVCDPGETCAQEPTACAGLQASCPSGQICVSGACSTIGNGICDSGETCAQEPIACEGQQAQCQVGETCISGSCVFNAQGSFNSCADYCDLFTGYTTGGCTQNPQQCSGLIPPGTYIGDVPGANATRGDSYCTTGNADTCCCQP